MVSFLIYKFFQPICHHNPTSTFTIDSVLLPVCVRCTSIYLGSLAGGLISIGISKFRKKNLDISVWVIYLPALLMILDVALNIFKLKEPEWSTKIITGSAFGIGIGWFLTLQLIKITRLKKA